MRIAGWKPLIATTGSILGIAVILSATAAPPQPQSAKVAAQEIVLSLDPAQTKVHYTVDSTLHTVHGTFNLKSGMIYFDPDGGKAGGEIVVYATSGDSGNSSRDDKMHKEVLQSRRFPEAVFKPTQIEGKIAPSGSSDVQLRGVLTLLGHDHEISATVHAELSGDHWKGSAKFDVPYIQWGLKDPSNFLLKVKPVVNIELKVAGGSKTEN